MAQESGGTSPPPESGFKACGGLARSFDSPYAALRMNDSPDQGLAHGPGYRPPPPPYRPRQPPGRNMFIVPVSMCHVACVMHIWAHLGKGGRYVPRYTLLPTPDPPPQRGRLFHALPPTTPTHRPTQTHRTLGLFSGPPAALPREPVSPALGVNSPGPLTPPRHQDPRGLSGAPPTRPLIAFLSMKASPSGPIRSKATLQQ